MSFSACSLPHASALTTTTYSSCDAQYFTAKTLASYEQASPTRSFARTVASVSAHSWLNVALICPTRYSEGIIHSALALATSGKNVDELSTQATADQEAALSLLTRESMRTTTLLHSDTYQALAQVEDRLRFSYEVIAARDSSVAQASEHAHLSSRMSEAFAVQAQIQDQDYKDTRARIYSTAALTDYKGIDAATGLAMSLPSALELDTALSELTALDADLSTQSSPRTPSEDSTQFARAIAQNVRAHMLRTLIHDAPKVRDLYLHQA
ncbi:hypothetical protein [Alloscardovia omnicolens]|uniref:hypothetical protein n=1 Tax=Alloscardovia omnicolens TaxID=419015 RepID=UPI003A643D9A